MSMVRRRPNTGLMSSAYNTVSRAAPYINQAGQVFRAAKRAAQEYRRYNKRVKPNRMRNLVNSKTGASTRIASKAGKFKGKRKRKLKVGKTLRKKIRKVMEDDVDTITGTCITVSRPQIEQPDADNLKKWFCYPYAKTSGGTNIGNEYSVLHSWAKVVHDANVLFCGYPATLETGTMASYPSSLIDIQSATIDVVYNKATYWLKNNGERTLFVSMYKCTAKQNMGNPDTPLRRWYEAYQNEAKRTDEEDNLLEDWVDGAVSEVTSIDDYRLLNAPWIMNPRFVRQFHKYYKLEEIKMIIEPGQTISQVVDLPVGEMKGKDFYTDTSYQAHHKGSVTVMFSMLPDIIQAIGQSDYATVGVPGYFGDAQGTTDGEGIIHNPEKGLIMECKIQRKIKMPEQTGFTVTGVAAGNPQALTLRRGPIYKTITWNNALPTNPLRVRTDEQNPSAELEEDL